MMHIKRLGLCAFGCLGVAAFTATAQARSMGGYGGQPAANVTSNASCLTESWGTVTQTCATGSGSAGWEFALPVDSATAYNPQISVFGGLNGVVSCGSVSASQVGGGFHQWSGTKPAPTTGNVTFQPGSVSVPAGGFLFVGCSLPPGTTVYSVVW